MATRNVWEKGFILISAFFLGAGTPSALAQQNGLAADGGFAAAALADCRTDLRYLNQVSGWQTVWPRQWEALAASGAPGKDALERWAGAPAAIAEAQEALLNSVEAGKAAPRAVVRRVHQQVSDLAAALLAGDPRYFSDSEDSDVWDRLLADEIAPAVAAFEKFLENSYLPQARKEPGLSAIENGAACFLGAVEWWTTLSLSAEEIEVIGERLLEATRAELTATAEPGEEFDDVMARLRDVQENYPTTAEELIAISKAALDRAHEKTLEAFSERAKSPIIVVVMPEHVQASFPAGYYQPPSAGGSAAYVINTSRPNERRLMAEVIAFHEGVPGHHLFGDYPRESDGDGFNAGLMEGWALYSEYVADEMGLYSTTFDRQGMIAKHLWASSRLVVEPGLHLHGWSREKAIDFMLEHTVMSRAEIEIEIDRYIAMPGQSLSYMLGADLILSERARARRVMGDAFDLAAFHDVILKPGARPLPKVRADIRRWAHAAG